jgi:DHA3 family macrolide efflux protein-like MFS transporter
LQNKQAIALLFTGNTLSGLATGITILAVPWYFSHQLEEPSLYGIGYGAITAVSFFWSLYAGTLIDRYSRKRIFQISKITCAIVIGAVAYLGFMKGYVPPAMALIAYATTFFNFNIHYPNLYAFGQEITAQADFGRLNSYIEIQGQATNALAGGLAAITLSGTAGEFVELGSFVPFALPHLSLHQILAIDAATYLVSFSVVSLIRYKPLQLRKVSTASVKTRVREGLSYLRAQPPVFVFGVLSNAIFITVMVHAFFLLAMYVNNHLETEAYAFGAAEMVFALGAIIAGIGIRHAYARMSPAAGVTLNTLIGSILLGVLSITESFAVLISFSLFYGIMNSGNRILRMTFIFNHIPNNIIGRINSVFSVSGTLLRVIFITAFALPFFGRAAHVVYAYMILATFVMIAGLILVYTFPKLNKMGKS